MKTILIFILSFVFFACSDDKKNKIDELDKTSLSENVIYDSNNFSDLLLMEPNEKNLSKNTLKSKIDKGFLSNEEAYKIIHSKHSLDDDFKLTLLNYTIIDSKQKWIYRINSTKKLIIKDAKVYEAVKTENDSLKIDRKIAEMTTVF